jgi:Domain of unknown function (DUF1905)
MPPEPVTPEVIDHRFSAPITKEANSGWCCAIMPNSGTAFGTRKPVKIAGTIDGHAFSATMLPIGDGTHMVPLKAALRKLIGKDLGATVTIHLQQRLS